jgi:hypothetical protein
VLNEPLTLHLLAADVGESVLLNSKMFVDAGFGDWVGFEP